MKLKNPINVRAQFMERRQWSTIEDIASGLDMARNTTSRALRGLPVRATTIMRIAESLEQQPEAIAEFTDR